MKLAHHFWGSHTGGAPLERIVFLHGMGGTGALWRPIAAGLEDEMQILALDQRGHGSSRITQVPGGRLNPGFTPLDYGQDIIDTLDSLHFHPTWIVGHSMGVRSAVAAAHLRPEWFQGLILIDLGFAGAAGGGLGDNLAQFIKILPQEFESRENAREFMTTHCPDPSITQYLMAVSVRAPSGHIHFPFDHSALIQTIAAAKNVNVREWVKELGQRKIPICILRGQNSLVWSRQEFEAEKDRFSGFPSIQFIEFPQAGHGLPFEQRPAFVQYLKDVVLTRP